MEQHHHQMIPAEHREVRHDNGRGDETEAGGSELARLPAVVGHSRDAAHARKERPVVTGDARPPPRARNGGADHPGCKETITAEIVHIIVPVHETRAQENRVLEVPELLLFLVLTFCWGEGWGGRGLVVDPPKQKQNEKRRKKKKWQDSCLPSIYIPLSRVIPSPSL